MTFDLPKKIDARNNTATPCVNIAAKTAQNRDEIIP